MEYHYKARVVDAYDADTITVDIDLGLWITLRNQKIRLYGINAPEMRGEERPEGIVARDWLRERIMGKEIILETIKDSTGKYGRLLGIIKEIVGEPPLEKTLNQQLIDAGLADPCVY